MELSDRVVDQPGVFALFQKFKIEQLFCKVKSLPFDTFLKLKRTTVNDYATGLTQHQTNILLLLIRDLNDSEKKEVNQCSLLPQDDSNAIVPSDAVEPCMAGDCKTCGVDASKLLVLKPLGEKLPCSRKLLQGWESYGQVKVVVLQNMKFVFTKDVEESLARLQASGPGLQILDDRMVRIVGTTIFNHLLETFK